MENLKNALEAVYHFAASDPVANVVKIMVIVTAAVGMYLILKQEAKINGLSAVSNSTAANSDSYWNRNKGRSAEGRRIKWTRILFILFVLEVLFLYMTM